MPLKRKHDGTFSYEFPFKKQKNEILLLPPSSDSMAITGRRTRRYTRRTRGYAKSYPKTRGGYAYGRPKYRGYARVNRGLPELKTNDVLIPFTPVGCGDPDTPTGYPYAGQISHTGATTDIFTRWNGSNLGGVIWVLNAMDAGSGLSNRVGRQVNCKSILCQLTWRLKNTLDNSQDPVAIRTMLVWDKSPNNILPPISDILVPITHVANTYPMPGSPNNLTYRDRFRTLWDIQDTLVPGGDSLRQYDKYLKLSGQTVYSGPGNPPSTPPWVNLISTGALYLILLSDARDLVGNTIVERPVCKITTRFRFTDN